MFESTRELMFTVVVRTLELIIRPVDNQTVFECKVCALSPSTGEHGHTHDMAVN